MDAECISLHVSRPDNCRHYHQHTVCSNPEMAESIEWLHCRMNDLTIAVRLPAGAVFLHFTTPSAGLEPIQSTSQWAPGQISLGIMRPASEADLSNLVPGLRISGDILLPSIRHDCVHVDNLATVLFAKRRQPIGLIRNCMSQVSSMYSLCKERLKDEDFGTSWVGKESVFCISLALKAYELLSKQISVPHNVQQTRQATHV
jgi:hypothetical protein